MALNNLFTDGEPNASPRIFSPRMQALEHLENALSVLPVQANAIVAHGKDPLIALPLSPDMDPRRLITTGGTLTTPGRIL